MIHKRTKKQSPLTCQLGDEFTANGALLVPTGVAAPILGRDQLCYDIQTSTKISRSWIAGDAAVGPAHHTQYFTKE